MITCPLGLRYVGGTRGSMKDRLSKHRSERSGCRLIRDAIHRHGWENMQISILMRCPVDSLDQNESLYIANLDTIHPRGYNLRCGSKAGAPLLCGMELSTIVLDHIETTDEMRKAVEEDIEDITGARPPSMTWSGPVSVSNADLNRMNNASTILNSSKHTQKEKYTETATIALTAFTILKDDTFPLNHNGIRFSKDMSMVDVMDCFTFVSASYGAARVLKTNYMSRTPLVTVVWEGCIPKRKRNTCTVSSMLKVLGLCTKPEAAVLSFKIANSSKLQNEKYAEAEVFDEYEYRKRMRDVNEARDKNIIKMDRLEKKIKFCKSVGDEERANRLMKKYINIE